MNPSSFARELNQKYFEGGLSAEVLKVLSSAPRWGAEGQRLIARTCRRMKEAGLRPHDIHPRTAEVFTTVLPSLLPSLWDGYVPSVTVKHRHEKIDQYVAHNPWRRHTARGVFLDVGCGFPPLTTVETAKRFPSWNVIGADPQFPTAILYDKHGHYALFNEQGDVQHIQANPDNEKSWLEFYKYRKKTRTRFLKMFQKQKKKLSFSNPLTPYERPNLQFVKRRIGAIDVRVVDVVRSFNVLVYFNRAFRTKALAWLAKICKPGALFICGTDWEKTTSARYTVYRCEEGAWQPKEFVFSADCLSLLNPFLFASFHDDDVEANFLASMLGALRSDSPFETRVRSFLDDYYRTTGLAKRNKLGYLTFAASRVSEEKLARARLRLDAALVKKGFARHAITVLRQAGYDAFVNSVEHIGIRL